MNDPEVLINRYRPQSEHSLQEWPANARDEVLASILDQPHKCASPRRNWMKESFEIQTAEISASTDLASTVRTRLARRRVIAGTSLAAGVLVCALSASSTIGSGNSTPRTKSFRLANYTLQVPAGARTGTSCLDSPTQWARSWPPNRPDAASIVGAMLSLNPDGTPNRNCVAAAFTFTTTPPPAIGFSTTSDGRTVYIAAATSQTRVAYIRLRPEDSHHGANIIYGPTSGTFYIIGEMRSDNDQSVLDAVLQRSIQILGP